MTSDKRLIEDFLPIQAISAEASREKSVRKGHISTLHLWWARRPLVACRAAVYGALVPASRFIPENGPDNKKQSLGRANAAKFIERLCKYPGNPTVIKEAQRHILEAHAMRLSEERGESVSVEDMESGKAPRPKVLDMFAGGGAIPLEALRLGCEAYALDLNPVAHIIELCTLVYPQKYGKPDPNARGMTGPKDAKGETTWGGLADEVRYWGEWVLKKVKAEIGDLYPSLPDMEFWSGTGCQPVNQELPLFPDTKRGVAKTRRHLPHWEKEHGCYFLTWRTSPGIELSAEARLLVLENLKFWSGKRYDLWQAVVMPDHVHVLLSPLEKEDGSFWYLSEILHTAKSYTANQINKKLGRSGALWQDERFDHLVRNPASFEEKWHYIRQNPCKNGLVIKPEDYEWLYEYDGLAARPTLTPVAYLWTRTVRCKNPSCGATVPLVRQTWLCKKKDRYIALRMMAPKGEKRVRFEVVESRTEKGLGFDPAAFSKGGNATCPFCGTVADSDYVKAEGQAGRLSSHQMMAIVCTRPGQRGKIYLSAGDYQKFIPDDKAIRERIEALCHRTGLTVPGETLVEKLTDQMPKYGMTTFQELFTPRQMLCLLTFAAAVRECVGELEREGVESERVKAVGTYLGVLVNRIVSQNNAFCIYHTGRETIENPIGGHKLAMVWDFVETAPLSGASGGTDKALDWIESVIKAESNNCNHALLVRGSATSLPWEQNSFDAVITDPPYYDNIQYASLSDFFYVWLKRTISNYHPEHFSSELTPKKSEAVASQWRQGGKNKARQKYENLMEISFKEAYRVLKPGGQIVVVYAHKTTLGWATLVDALRRSGFEVTEAWPLDTEMKAGVVKVGKAMLASSIFLVARKREGEVTGSYEDEVQPELEKIVRERVDSLWKMGITGADLVIAAVGAGLRAFTRFSRVEYANGEKVPAEKFLAEVEGVVLETLLEKIFGLTRSGVAAVDGPSRFYVLWRYTYKAAEMDAGEAIVFTYGQNIELDGQNGLSSGSRALVEKKKGKYRLRDFTERGDDEKLGMPKDDLPAVPGAACLPNRQAQAGLSAEVSVQAGGKSAPLIDILHRILWLVENEPRKLNNFLDKARPDRERLRLLAQTLAGTALEGGQASSLSEDGRNALHPTVATTPAEGAALKKLVANWRALIETRLSDVDLKSRQRKLFS